MKPTQLICCILLLISCSEKPKPKPKVITIDPIHFEILQGKVKQVIEINNENRATNTITTDFDKHGDAIQTNNKGEYNNLWKYEYKYNKGGKKTDLIAHGGGNHPEFNQRLYQYDTLGRIAEMSFPTKEIRDDSDYELKRMRFVYRYDKAGNQVQTDVYYEKDHQLSEKYKYNQSHFLIEKDNGTKIVYRYLHIDKKGNWLMQVQVRKAGEHAARSDTITRIITYY